MTKSRSRGKKSRHKTQRKLSDQPIHLLNYILAFIIAVFLWAFFFFIKFNRSFMMWLTQYITSPIKHGISYLCDFMPYDVAEFLFLAAGIYCIIFIIRSTILIHGHLRKSRMFLARLLLILSLCLYAYDAMTLLWGFNYYTESFCVQTGISDRGCRDEELYTLLKIYVNKANALAPLVHRNDQGLFEQDPDQLLSQGNDVYRGLIDEFPLLDGPDRTPRGMISSKMISYLNFTGFFCPYTGEILINTDQPVYLVPATVLHEISHQRNIASEQECNFIAILAGSDCGNIDYEYSTYMFAYIHLANALYKANKELWSDAVSMLCPEAARDNKANSDYWARFKTPVKTVTEKAYSGFIEGYGESDGLASYEKCVNLLVAYYFDYAPEALQELERMD